jgi:hypothetical protein
MLPAVHVMLPDDAIVRLSTANDMAQLLPEQVTLPSNHSTEPLLPNTTEPPVADTTLLLCEIREVVVSTSTDEADISPSTIKSPSVDTCTRPDRHFSRQEAPSLSHDENEEASRVVTVFHSLAMLLRSRWDEEAVISPSTLALKKCNRTLPPVIVLSALRLKCHIAKGTPLPTEPRSIMCALSPNTAHVTGPNMEVTDDTFPASSRGNGVLVSWEAGLSLLFTRSTVVPLPYRS